MSRKRANGEGCITKEKSGRYRVVISVWINGKRERRSRTAWKHADAVALLDELRGDASKMLDVRKITLQQHLTEWLEKIVIQKNKRAANTIESYRRAIEKQICPTLGRILLKRLSPDDIESWVYSLITEKVGSRTIENAFKILRSGLKWALRIRRIIDDPIAEISKPSHVSDDICPFSLEESKKILAASDGTRAHAMVALGIKAGMRSGELFGLPWRNVDLKSATIWIDQQAVEINGTRTIEKPKTKCSIRSVNLTPDAVEALRAHKAILLREGNAGSELVFPAPGGGIESRANFRQRVWLKLLKKAGVKPRGFHHTRHTYATLSLAAGVDVAVVSKQLGHAKTSITYDIYHHVLPDHKMEGTQTMSKLFA